MLSFVRIIKNELHKQDKLPDKYNDYGIGKLYNYAGEVLDIGVSENINYNKTEIYLCPTGLDPAKSWELKFKISLYQSESGNKAPNYQFVALNNAYNGAGSTNSDYDRGLSINSSYHFRAYKVPSSSNQVELRVSGDPNPCSLEVYYKHEENNENVYSRISCPLTGEFAEGTYKLPNLKYWTVRPRLRAFKMNGTYVTYNWEKYVHECYPKDFEFKHDGKIIFKH